MFETEKEGEGERKTGREREWGERGEGDGGRGWRGGRERDFISCRTHQWNIDVNNPLVCTSPLLL